MPLAIELAAARVKLLPPEAILRRLEHQLELLAARLARPARAAADPARRDRLELRPARAPASAGSSTGCRCSWAAATSSGRGAGLRPGRRARRIDVVRRARRRSPTRASSGATTTAASSALQHARHDPRVRRGDGWQRDGESAEIRAPPRPGLPRPGRAMRRPDWPATEQRDLARPARARSRQHPRRARLGGGDARTPPSAIRLAFAHVALLAEARPPQRGAASGSTDDRGQPWSHDDPILRARLCEALGGVA